MHHPSVVYCYVILVSVLSASMSTSVCIVSDNNVTECLNNSDSCVIVDHFYI